jgi:hypothetical protein
MEERRYLFGDRNTKELERLCKVVKIKLFFVNEIEGGIESKNKSNVRKMKRQNS